MNINDAAKILDIEGELTRAIIKAAYRKAAAKYHPDHNAGGLEMMKAVNQARDILMANIGKHADKAESEQKYGEELMRVINACAGVGLTMELCGSWLWITGDTKPFKDMLKQHGCRWAPKKKSWYFRPDDWKSSARGRMTMDQIREKHGSKEVKGKARKQIAA